MGITASPNGITNTSTENVVPKTDASGNLLDSRISDDGTKILAGVFGHALIEISEADRAIRLSFQLEFSIVGLFTDDQQGGNIWNNSGLVACKDSTPPSVDPDIAGRIWNDSGTLKVSGGQALQSTIFDNLLAQSAANSSIITQTPLVNGTYRVGGYLTITAVSLDVIQLRVTYTDENGVARTQTFFPQGLTSANLSATGAYAFSPIDIRSQAGGVITVLTVLTTGAGSIAYDVGASIQQLN